MQKRGRDSVVDEIVPLWCAPKHSGPDHLAKYPGRALSESLKGGGVFGASRTGITKAPDQPLAPHGDDSGGAHTSGAACSMRAMFTELSKSANIE